MTKLWLPEAARRILDRKRNEEMDAWIREAETKEDLERRVAFRRKELAKVKVRISSERPLKQRKSYRKMRRKMTHESRRRNRVNV